MTEPPLGLWKVTFGPLDSFYWLIIKQIILFLDHLNTLVSMIHNKLDIYNFLRNLWLLLMNKVNTLVLPPTLGFTVNCQYHSNILQCGTLPMVYTIGMTTYNFCPMVRAVYSQSSRRDELVSLSCSSLHGVNTSSWMVLLVLGLLYKMVC